MKARAAFVGGVLLLHASTLAQQAAPAEQVSRLLSTLRARIPASGAIEYLYSVEDGEGFARIAGGYDFGTRAFYYMHAGKVCGREPGGATFAGDEDVGLRAASDLDGWPVTDAFLDNSLPCVMLAAMIHDPSRIVAVESQGNGFVIDVQHPGAFRGAPIDWQFPAHGKMPLKTTRIEIDERGRVLRWRPEFGSTSVVLDAEYSEEAAPGVPLLSHVVGQSSGRAFALREFKWHDGPAENLFSRERVARLAKERATRFRPAALELPNANTPEPESIPEWAQSVVKPGDSLSSWQWPLVGLGVVFIVVGAIAWRRGVGR